MIVKSESVNIVKSESVNMLCIYVAKVVINYFSASNMDTTFKRTT